MPGIDPNLSVRQEKSFDFGGSCRIFRQISRITPVTRVLPEESGYSTGAGRAERFVFYAVNSVRNVADVLNVVFRIQYEKENRKPCVRATSVRANRRVAIV